ncbi:MAG: hypothetical protein EBZ48_06595 [Proteobacteria bacterium]|nr:hypothetical protein [Pseudomonadota bacterium]
MSVCRYCFGAADERFSSGGREFCSTECGAEYEHELMLCNAARLVSGPKAVAADEGCGGESSNIIHVDFKLRKRIAA